MLVTCSQKRPFWLISTVYSFENNKTSLVCVLCKKLSHSKHTLLNNLLTIVFHLLSYGYIDLLFELTLSCNNEHLNQLYKQQGAVAIDKGTQTTSSMFFISNKRGQYYISVILMYLLFWYFYKIWWKARIYTCKNEQLLFWINRNTFTMWVSDWTVSYLLDSKNIIWAREIHRVVKNQVKYFQKS